MDILINIDMNMNIIIYIWFLVIYFILFRVVLIRFFGGISIFLFGWSVLDCCFVCGFYGFLFIGFLFRVFYILFRFSVRCSILVGYVIRGCWISSWIRRVWFGFCLYGFLKFLLIWKKLMIFKEYIWVYRYKWLKFFIYFYDCVIGDKLLLYLIFMILYV